jgi:16S rRNA (cytosine1402-N4)-methyltransferase
MNAFSHTTVLLDEAVDALAINASGFYVDGTFGRGGHSKKVLEHLDAAGRLLVIDKDPEAIVLAQSLAEADERVLFWQGSFKDIDQALNELGVKQKVDGLLLDLGVSSPQLDDASRGFSFMREGALDMRMNPAEGLSVADWLQQADEVEIADVLWRYGEEKKSRRIAKAIVQKRQEIPFETTTQLASFIAELIPVPRRSSGAKAKHPATRSFQALRVYINQELADLEDFLEKVPDVLAKHGRLVVISFHSLEDRLVKQYLKQQSSPPKIPKGLPVMDVDFVPVFKLHGRAIKPSDQEVEMNPRARSAVMRVAERQV